LDDVLDERNFEIRVETVVGYEPRCICYFTQKF
jgi:hypothetical protein